MLSQTIAKSRCIKEVKTPCYNCLSSKASLYIHYNPFLSFVTSLRVSLVGLLLLLNAANRKQLNMADAADM
jgi:hypothetical protein